MTQQNNDQYKFEEVKSNPKELFSNIDGASDNTEYPNPIPGVFESLYDEVINRCDPANFLNPYNQEKVRISNELYSKSKALENKNDEKVLKEIRKRAIKELGIKFSTVELYEKLEKICDVHNYTGDNYNQDYLNLANTLYGQIMKYADDIEKLEDIDTQTGDLVAELQRREEEVGRNKQKKLEEERKLREIKDKKTERLKLINERDSGRNSFIIGFAVFPILLFPLIFILYSEYTILYSKYTRNEKQGLIIAIAICSIIFIIFYIWVINSYISSKKTINSKIAAIEKWLQEYGTLSSDGSETEAKGTN